MTPEDLEPMLERVVSKVLQAITTADAVPLASRFGFSEAEAAALIGVEPYVLRDERRKGNIIGRKVGRRVFYSPERLRQFIEATPI